MKTNAPQPLLIACALIACASLLSGAPELKTKIELSATAEKQIHDDAPCYLVYPEGDALDAIRESGANETIEKAIRKMGYSIVASEQEAVVFIKVAFARFEPFQAEVEVKGRNRIDYSNAASTRNHAAMMKGGRYQQLADPQQHRDRNNVESILGPSGEVIQLADQEAPAPKVVEGETVKAQATFYPIALEVSAWKFDSEKPVQLWSAVASYNNTVNEETEPQLLDLCKAASRYFGKNLKSSKFVTRR